ncbi:MAG: hypothetical protein KAS86_00300 [Candidatus Omnitrophica bacterium]|nr:hypothetical protein [Candidatus Omnitrophota bacterium]
MFKNFFKTTTGLLLVPVAIATARAFYLQISSLSGFSNALLILERGVFSYLLFHVLVMRPVYLYVFGHEIVHVLATWMCGGRVESFNAGRSGGNVATSKTNFFIELSPYFVPFYTLLLGPVFMLIRAMIKFAPDLSSVFLFLVGFTLAFHFVMTTEVLKMKQPDIVRSGIVLSFVVIFVFNLIITLAVFCPFFSTLSFLTFIKSIAAYSAQVYVLIFDHVSRILLATP